MNKREAEDYVYQSYLRAAKYQAYDAPDSEKRRPDLTRELIRKLCHTPCVVVTGSKGKGSVSCMISQILQSEWKTGLMTSPHLIDFCERFRVDGEPISEEVFARYIEILKPRLEEIGKTIPKQDCISPMGIQAAAGLLFFQERKTDFNIFEGGKGARYDDVNNIRHEYAVINSIFLEHTRELGDTLEEIAEDKSYVINGEQKCVYIAKQTESVERILRARAEEYDVPVKCYGIDFVACNIAYTNKGMRFDVSADGRKYRGIKLPLLGLHQAKNCALAMALCQDVLGSLNLSKVKEKLAALNWPGRMEIIGSDPFMLLDACINRASCKDILQVLGHLPYKQYEIIVGIPDDKDYQGVVEAVWARAKTLFLTRSQNPHYLFTKKQQETLRQQGIETVPTDSVEEAVTAAKRSGNPILILGTTSVVAEVKKLQAQGYLWK